MISLKDLENSNACIISNSRKEDQDIIKFLESYGYRPWYKSCRYERLRSNYSKVCFVIGGFGSNLIDVKAIADTDVLYHLNEIQEYNQYSDKLSVGDKVFIDTSKYPEIEGRIGVLNKIDNYKGKITYRVDIYGCSNNKSTDGLYLFDKSQITRVETKAGKEATLTICDDRGYDAKEFDTRYMELLEIYRDRKNAKFDVEHMKERFEEGENKMELLKIYRDRKTDKLIEDADKARSKAWEKNSTYKTLKDLSEKTKTKADYLFTFNFNTIPDSVREEIDKIQKDREEKEIQLSRFVKEVEAQLKECETYEQKINILKAYEILDEKGKVNA